MKILITGGAGFIGSHLADDLLARGHHVRVLDALLPQVHGDLLQPDYLAPEVELIQGDVRDSAAVRQALEGVEAVCHLAAAVGVGQSMYQMQEYVSVNGVGTAVLLEELARRPVRKLIVASSMSIYGEGLYRAADGTTVSGRERPLAQLKARDWEVRGEDGAALSPVGTPETKVPGLPSVYAITKYEQERLVLVAGRAYGIPTVALRFFNVYGTRQALSNPYTGVLAIFASRYLNGRPPLINEDGAQRRDFVHVRDVAAACRQALEQTGADGLAVNIGSGQSATVAEIAAQLAAVVGRADLAPEITGRFRMGDIRHCFADIALARRALNYQPRTTLADGLAELAEWLAGRTALDRVDAAAEELVRRGLSL